MEAISAYQKNEATVEKEEYCRALLAWNKRNENKKPDERSQRPIPPNEPCRRKRLKSKTTNCTGSIRIMANHCKWICIYSINKRDHLSPRLARQWTDIAKDVDAKEKSRDAFDRNLPNSFL